MCLGRSSALRRRLIVMGSHRRQGSTQSCLAGEPMAPRDPRLFCWWPRRRPVPRALSRCHARRQGRGVQRRRQQRERVHRDAPPDGQGADCCTRAPERRCRGRVRFCRPTQRLWSSKTTRTAARFSASSSSCPGSNAARRNAASGVAALGAKAPRSTIIDLGLPGMDGFELARIASWPRGSEITAVALTGYGQPSDREDSRAAGFDAHLVKPVHPDQLLTLVSKLRDTPGRAQRAQRDCVSAQ